MCERPGLPAKRQGQGSQHGPAARIAAAKTSEWRRPDRETRDCVRWIPGLMAAVFVGELVGGRLFDRSAETGPRARMHSSDTLGNTLGHCSCAQRALLRLLCGSACTAVPSLMRRRVDRPGSRPAWHFCLFWNSPSGPRCEGTTRRRATQPVQLCLSPGSPGSPTKDEGQASDLPEEALAEPQRVATSEVPASLARLTLPMERS